MRIWDCIKELSVSPEKIFKCTTLDWKIKKSSTKGVSIIRNDGKQIKTDTLGISGVVMSLEWEESRKSISSVEALSIRNKKIRPVVKGAMFATSEEWLLNICENRNYLTMLWEVE